MGAVRDRRLAWLAAVVLAAGLFLAVVPGDPPGFYQDEAAIAYNAWSIEQTGHDEYGATMPLFFRSFDDYKSPVYVYLLAGVFRVVGPSIEAARILSAVLGLAAVLGLGLLAARVTGRQEVGAAITVLAALTPWLFEVTRLVFEVAFLPLALVLLLLAVWKARERCEWRDAAAIGVALGLVTYSYAAGRLLGPLLAAALLVFWRAWGWRGIGRTWLVYALTLVPLLAYTERHPGALSARFSTTSYLNRHTPVLDLAHELVVDYFRDINPWAWVVHGDPTPRHHVPGLGGSLLVAVVLLAAGGIVYAVLRRWHDPWWRFALIGLLIAPLPGAITYGPMTSPRLVAFPIFLLLFAALALSALLEFPGRRVGLTGAAAALLAGALQGALFQYQFRAKARAPDRVEAFQALYPDVLAQALLRPGPVYVFQQDPTYADGLWYGVLDHAHQRIVPLAPGSAAPAGGTVVAFGGPCQGCRVVTIAGDFSAYVAP
jgi:4-amino-4-deoxy-L-arabinose transferase-like glycosyltransferase